MIIFQFQERLDGHHHQRFDTQHNDIDQNDTWENEMNALAFGSVNRTSHFKECKQLSKYQHLVLLREIWWSKL
jgi:hypothetical protein